jgi:signal peptidase II
VSTVRRAPPWLVWGLAALVVVLDWLTKRWAIAVLAPREPIALLGDFLRLTFTRNTGVAFGLLADLRLPLGWVSVLALVFVLWLALRSGTRDRVRATALGLILGGAVGNLIDRVRWGSVVDFVDLGIGSLRWPVFNLADSAITVGVLLWAGQILFRRAPHPEEASPDGAGA